MLLWRKENINRTLCAMYHYNGAQWDKQASRLDRASISLYSDASESSVLIHGAIINNLFKYFCHILTFFSLPFSELSLLGLTNRRPSVP